MVDLLQVGRVDVELWRGEHVSKSFGRQDVLLVGHFARVRLQWLEFGDQIQALGFGNVRCLFWQ